MAKPAVAGRRGASVWFQGLACGALATLATPTALLAGMLLIPSFVVATLDRGAGKPVARAVLLCGLAASALPMADLWAGGYGMGQGVALATDPRVLAVAWAAQAAGWLMAALAPVLVRVLLDAHAGGEMARLRRERAALEADWASGQEAMLGQGGAKAR